MKRIFSVGVTATLVAASVAALQAAPRTTESTFATRTSTLMQDMAARSSALEQAADKLHALSVQQENPDVSGQLYAIRENVNQIGRDLRILQSEKEALPAADRQAIARVRPMMPVIAADTSEAIQNYNTHRDDLWAIPFSAEANKIYREAARVDRDLHLALARDKELRLESKLSTD